MTNSLGSIFGKAGLHVSVLAGFAAEANAQSLTTLTHDIGPKVSARFAEVFAGASAFFENIGQTLIEKSPDGSLSWYLVTSLWSLVFIAVGYAALVVVNRWGRAQFMYLFNPTPQSRAEKIGYLLVRAALMSMNVAVFTGIAMALAGIASGSEIVARNTHFLQIGAVAVILEFRVLSLNLLAPDAPSHRTVGLDDATAWSIHRGFVGAFVIAVVIFFTCMWMFFLGLDHDTHLIMLIGGTLIIALIFASVAVLQRKPIAQVMLETRHGEPAPVPVRLIARTWHVVAVLYFLGAWMVSASRLLLDLPTPIGPVIVPVTALFAGSYAYGLLLVIIDKFARRKPVMVQMASDVEAQTSAEIYTGRTLKDLAEHVAAIVVWFGAFMAIANAWGAEVFNPDSLFVELADFMIVGFLGYTAYLAVKITVDQKIWEERSDLDPEELQEYLDEGRAPPESRLATFLPLARNFLVIVVVATVAMIFASEAGIDIGPLFAGAGVIGVAIGFGSQALITDIFSGAFFLIDDAFRKGDYIDTGTAKGTVEKISIRSFQLRHHMGALHTIPFGQITQLTNYSRDWAMMKLKLRLTYGTDVERVRKLIKKLGIELQEDPEIGDKFIQPLKSQGVYAMEDSAMIIRVKFMTRPGDQFVVRKKVYARIRELFEQNNITFAHREVTVRLAGEGAADPEKLTDEQKKQISGAVLPVVDEAQNNPEGSGDGR